MYAMSPVPLNVISNFSGHPTPTNHHKLALACPIVIRSSLFSDHPIPIFSHQNRKKSSLSTINHTIPSTTVFVKSSILKTNISNVVVKTLPATTLDLEKIRKRVFWFRKWDLLDLANMCMVVSIHALALCAPFVFDWGAFEVTLVLSFMTGIGLTLGYHRLLTHRSFKVPKWLEYFFAYCGVHAFQSDPIFWVSVHKYHHQHVDTERDPHPPSKGFWFSHMGWFLYNDYLANKCGESKGGEYSNVEELKKQPYYRFLHNTCFWHPIALGVLLYLYGGFPYMAWAMGLRCVVVQHITFLVNSGCHLWGERPWNTGDTSTNNWWIAILTMGEGWHNNHHAFPKSARHGLKWWQFDLTWQVIKFLQVVGLATDVKLPTEAEKRKMAFSKTIQLKKESKNAIQINV